MTTKKHIRIAVALAAAGSMFLAGCGTSSDDAGDTPETPAPETAQEAADQPDAPDAGDADADADAAAETRTLAQGDLVGVALPWVGTQNWAEANDWFGAAIEAAGYQAVVLAADNKATNQQAQVDSLVEQGAKAIIIGAVDGEQLGTVAENAKNSGAWVIGYDREILNTEAVDAIAQYNAFGTGVLQAEALLQGLAEKVSPEGPWVIEVFAGGPADPNAKLFYDGAISVLQPLIDDGTLTVPSGQTEFTQVATAEWANDKAQSRMDSLLAGNYTGGKGPDGVLSPNDGIARAIITASENAGVENMPILDGLDAEDESIQWIRDGKQYSTVAKPTQPLIDETIRILQAIEANGALPEPTSTRLNGVKDVPLFELTPVIITQSNVAEYFPED
jgi:putative multiple sugar transport system substrate-binding protein